MAVVEEDDEVGRVLALVSGGEVRDFEAKGLVFDVAQGSGVLFNDAGEFSDRKSVV